MIVALDNATIGLIVAIFAVLLSAISLTWQAATFQLTGPLIRVRLREGLRHTATGALFAGPLTAYIDGPGALAALGYTQHVLAIEVANRGRLAANVTSWRLILADGRAVYVNADDPLNPPLPHRLEPHSVVPWSTDALTIMATDRALGPEFRGGPIRAEVEAGSRRVRSRNAYRLEGGETFVEIVPRRTRLARRLARKSRKPHG